MSRDDLGVKIVTYHADRKIRIWQGADGTCLRVSEEVGVEQGVVGLVEN